ncbi:spore germination protein [Clostridium sp. BSD9I1]|uniref:spore germination protein n=1 Tax=Clostridium sp. BSD9I1 TaxID=2003589 RepID=UPI00164405DB|nr:spore germination protein [Clostridium sp. BSD9I1]
MSKEYKNIQISNTLKENVDFIKSILENNISIIYKEFESRAKNSLLFCIIFSENQCDIDRISRNILNPIMSTELGNHIPNDNRIDLILNKVVLTYDNNRLKDIEACIDNILNGNTILFVDGCSEAISINTEQKIQRSITEPESNKVTRGPKEGFTEAIETNIALIQQIIHSPELKFKTLTLGVQTKSKICIVYMDNIASHDILCELEKRLDLIDVDAIIDSHYIEEFITDTPLSVFNTTGYTDRPDVACGKLLEGRILLICNGSPDVITLPFIFLENFQSNEDYYKGFAAASFYRILRFMAFIITTCTPAIYLAITTYHQELLPTPLLVSILASRDSVPFPTIVELIFMLFVFELIIEASRRLPSNIGQTVSIVGALVLGEAAVSARFISAPIIIITAITGTSSFLVPSIEGPIVFIRIMNLIFAALLGLYGFIFSIIILEIYLFSLRSFGIPYTLGLSTFRKYDLQDTLIRSPWWYMKYRPRLISAKNFLRQKVKGNNFPKGGNDERNK